MSRRVVVTGMGITLPGAFTVSDAWDKIINKQSFITKIDNFNTESLPTKIAGEMKFHDRDYSGKTGFMYENRFNPETFMDKKEVKRMDNFILYGLSAAKHAVEDAGIENISNKERVSVLLGSGIGGLGPIEENSLKLRDSGPKKISPFFLPSVLINLLSGHVSMAYGFTGISYGIVSACATAAHSIGEGARTIMTDDADIAIVGGAESAVTELGIAGFNALRALSDKYNETPEKASRPWDTGRDGFVMGEGAGILVLEEYEHAKKRGAKIYCELVGYGASSDAYHLTAPHPEGLGGLNAMKMAIKKAKIDANEIDYINAHGTSTPLGDVIEVTGLKSLFREDGVKKVSVSSTKSATGHLLGAAGGIEAIFSILAIQNQVCPPTLNLENPSEGCDIDLCANNAKQRKINYALSNSFGFGGCNASLLFKKV